MLTFLISLYSAKPSELGTIVEVNVFRDKDSYTKVGIMVLNIRQSLVVMFSNTRMITTIRLVLVRVLGIVEYVEYICKNYSNKLHDD